MSLAIVHYNDRVLRKKGEKITLFDKDLTSFANEMIDTMHEARGIGLAAQQVGRAAQLCVVDLCGVESEFDWSLDGSKTPLELFMPMVMANPRLEVDSRTPTAVAEEGCLSFPEIRGDIERPVAVTARYQDAFGVEHTLQCTGLLARCIQHEVDHLNGVLFIDRMAKPVRSEIADALKALAKDTRAGQAPAKT